ncbi:MAG: hypothetical protein C4344_00285, partial [Acidimicrobiia bacterium]
MDGDRVRRRGFWARAWVRRSLAGLLAVAVLTPLVVDDLRVRGRLASTRDHLASTRLDLTRTRTELHARTRELTSTRVDLDERTRERDELQARLDVTNAELAGVRNSLGEAQSRINLQAGQIATLRSCLNGVTQALLYVADGYYSLA